VHDRNKPLALYKHISDYSRSNCRILKAVLFSLVLIVSTNTNAQIDEDERRKITSALVVVIDYVLSEDIPKVDQAALILGETNLDVFIGSNVSNVISGGTGNGSLVFSNANPSIASVDARSGQITGLTNGSTTVTVFKRGNRFYFNGESESFSVNVLERLEQPILEFLFSTIDLDIIANASNTLSGGAGNGAVSYSSLDPSIASVDGSSGLVTGVAAGSTTISANKAGDPTYMDAAQVSYVVTVNKIAQSSLSFASAGLTIEAGLQGSNLASGGDGTGVISYSSDAPQVASVNVVTGEVTAVAIGNAMITAFRTGDNTHLESDGVSYTVNVTEDTPADCVWDNDNWDECNWQ
jgi:uncharacterized protein YaiE (UPF0345 family)